MPTCPNGHQSGSDDWCEVCGHRMAPGAPPGAAPPPSYGYPPQGDPNATAVAELCPQCRTPREAMAPYCEECRYNFLTHTATSYTPLAPPPQQQSGLNLPSGFTSQPPPRQQPPQQGHGQQQHDPFDYQGSRPSQLNRPAEPLNDPSGRQHSGYAQPPGFPQGPGHQGPGHQSPPPYQQQPAPPIPQQPHQPGGDDWMIPPPSQPQGSPGPQNQGMQAGLSLFQQQSGPSSHGSAPSQYGEQGRQMQSSGHEQGDPGRHQSAPPYQPQGGWTAVVAPDREYFLAMMQRSGPDATGLTVPAYSPEQRLPLSGSQITIGRRRQSTGEAPDIDLSVPPEDPGVSHKHAVLVQQQDGSWAVVDQNSTNGTTINGGEEPIQPYVPVALNDGDRVHVGAWTTITVRRG